MLLSSLATLSQKDAVNATVISSQFMQKFQTDGYKGVARWYRKVNFKVNISSQ